MQNPQSQFPRNQQSQFLPNAQNPQSGYQPSFHPPQSQYLQNQQSQVLHNPQIPQPQNTSSFQYHFTDRQMRHYFFKPSKRYIQLIVWGVVVCVLGLIIGAVIAGLTGSSGSSSPYGSGSYGNGSYGSGSTSPSQGSSSPISAPTIIIALGIGLIAGGGIPLFLHYKQRPTPEQYDAWVAERSQSLYNTALQRVHLDEKFHCERIVEIEGGISSLLQLTKKLPEKEIVVKRLPNGFRHYSINACIYIFLTKNEIAIYSGYINALTQNERFEDADRYYYKDIVAISTSGPVYTFWDGTTQREIQMQGFLVRATNGDVIGTDYATRVILRDGNNREQLRGIDDVVPFLLHFLQDHKLTQIEAGTITQSVL